MATTVAKSATVPPKANTTVKKVEKRGVNVTSKKAGTNASNKDNDNDYLKNPFKIPEGAEGFTMREKERQVKEEVKDNAKSLKVWEKGVHQRKNFRKILEEDADDVAFYEDLKQKNANKLDVAKNSSVDRHFARENVQDFISKKREMFLVQYALGVKKEEMRKLEDIAQTEEKRLLEDEKTLEEDAAKFDAFLKENDKNSVEAIIKAEVETKAKLEKIQEIKKINNQILSLRSEMSKNDDQLRDLQRYRQFLEKLTPKEFLDDQVAKRKKEKDDQSDKVSVISSASKNNKLAAGSGRVIRKSDARRKRPVAKPSASLGSAGNATITASKASLNLDAGDDDAEGTIIGDEDEFVTLDEEEPSLFFKSPQQLLDLFAELEENNLALIQNCQESEEALEELKQKIAETEGKMEKETSSLKQQIDSLNELIAKEEEKARSLEERTKVFSSGYSGDKDHEKSLEELHSKVKEVYRKTLSDNDANLSTLQMLTNIENHLESLFELIETMPQDKVEQAEKIKEKERRQRIREEKLEAQKMLQEERVRKALERAKAPVKVAATGKAKYFRSALPEKKKKKETVVKNKDEEDSEWYWG